jgi:hypothetical protein
MKKSIYIALFLMISALSSCGDGDQDIQIGPLQICTNIACTPEPAEPGGLSSIQRPLVNGSGVVYTDAVGDVGFSFIDMTTLTANITDSDITVLMTVAAVPATLPYDRTCVSEGTLEYSWSIVFDANNTNRIDAGDLRLDAMRFKQPGAVPREGPIPAFTQYNVWEFTSATSMHTVGQPLTTGLAVTGNTISMTVSKSAYTGLSNITSATRYYFETT